MDAAGSAAKADEIRGELTHFANALRVSGDLRDLYANPGIEEATKLKITKELASRMRVSELAGRTLEALVRFHRMKDIDAILAALSAYVNQQLGVAVAEVRSAKGLTAEEKKDLAGALSAKVGKRVELDVHTDPALLGGFVVKIGSEIWDASVSGKINKFRESLV